MAENKEERRVRLWECMLRYAWEAFSKAIIRDIFVLRDDTMRSIFLFFVSRFFHVHQITDSGLANSLDTHLIDAGYCSNLQGCKIIRPSTGVHFSWIARALFVYGSETEGRNITIITKNDFPTLAQLVGDNSHEKINIYRGNCYDSVAPLECPYDWQNLVIERMLAIYAVKKRVSVLIYGPPGTGKTSTALVFATAMRTPRCAPTIYPAVTRTVVKNYSSICSRVTHPSIFTWNEYDEVQEDWSLKKDAATRVDICNILDGWGQAEHLAVIATTNQPISSFDPAFTRAGRFDLHCIVSVVDGIPIATISPAPKFGIE